MYLFRSYKIKHAIAFGVGAAIGMIYFMSVLTANADVIGGISIAGNGQTVVHGARVIEVTDSEIIARSTWGASTIQWKISVSGSTRFSPATEKHPLKEFIHIGETVGFSGQLNTFAEKTTVDAYMLRNESVVQAATILDGTLLSSTASEFMVQTESGTSTIALSQGTIITQDGNRVAAADLLPGETIKAFGTFNNRTRILEADRVGTVSLPKIPNTGAPQKRGLFAHIVSWLRLGSSVLSVR